MPWCVKQIGGPEYCGFTNERAAWKYIREGWSGWGIRYSKPYWKPY